MVITGDLADLINAVQANDQNEVDIKEIKRFKSDKSKCQDFGQYASSCPGWTGYCKDDLYGDWMQIFCKKSCGLCPQGPGTVMATPFVEFQVCVFSTMTKVLYLQIPTENHPKKI